MGLLLLPAVRQPAQAQFQFQFNAETSEWTLANGVVSAVFAHKPDGRFLLVRLTLAATGDVWESSLGDGSSPIALTVEDTRYDASTPFELVTQSARAVARGGYRQTIVLADAARRAEFTVELELYPGHPVLRYRVRYRNLEAYSRRVRAADLLPWSFRDRGATFRSLRVNQWKQGGSAGNFEPLEAALATDGAPVEFFAGSSAQHCGWVALRDSRNRGLVAGWEYDGRVSGAITHAPPDLHLATAIIGLSRTVAPNGQFASPAGFIGLFRGDWDEAGWRTQRFAEAAIAQPPPDDKFPYVTWDSWKYGENIDEWTMRRNAEIAARIGIEVFVLDLGWARQVGDWFGDPRKFPSGLRALADYVHRLGMKFGLHYPFAEAMDNSPVLRLNPDWKTSVPYGYYGASSLCLSHQPVKTWLIRETLRMIDDYAVDWIVQDGDNMVKECTKYTHTHAPDDSNYANAVDGLNSVIASIQRQRPRVHWENCEAGGTMMTYNMLRQYVTSIAADDSGPLKTRQAVFGVTYPFPPRYADRYMPEEKLTEYATRSYMFGGPWIFMNRLASMDEEDLRLAAAEVSLYKTLRGHLREGKVIRLTPRPEETRSDAIESYHPGADSAIVFVYRANVRREPVVKPRGLNADKLYRVRFQTDPRILLMRGSELASTGIQMNMGGPYQAEIIYVSPADAEP